MSVVHLDLRVGTLCERHGVLRTGTDSIHLVTCTRCSRRLVTLNADGWGDLLERRYEARTRAAAEAVGLDSVLDFLAAQDDGDSAYVHMVGGIIRTVAVYLHESGYTAPARLLAAEPEQEAAA